MFPKAFRDLIAQFGTLPGIGPRMAERLVLYLCKQDPRALDAFAASLGALGALTRCQTCFMIADDDLCAFCRDTGRDRSLLCVVEEPLDIVPIERTGAYTGLYHVLGGTLAHGADADRRNEALTIPQLLSRVRAGDVTEVILATNPTAEGDATALYLRRHLADTGVAVSRLARGLTTGADIEYADDLTLRSAIARRETLA